MKLKHLAIFFLLFAILTYVVFMLIETGVVTAVDTAEDVTKETDATAELVTENKTTEIVDAAENNDAIIKKKQALFDRTFADMTYSGYALNHRMDIPEAILRLKTLITQGANPNKKLPFSNKSGEGDYILYTPISYIFVTCDNDFTTYGADDRNFYLDIVKLLIDSGVDWNAENIHQGDDYSVTTTIADRLKQTENDPQHKPHCIEALNYVKNHLKENNITLEETKEIKQDDAIKKNQALFDKLFKEMTQFDYSIPRGLNHDMDIPEAILRLKALIAQGANPNKKISYYNGSNGSFDTPISYLLLGCINDDEANHTNARNFYLEIVKLLIDSGVDWNDKNSYETESDGGSDKRPLTERFERVEENADKLQCIEALDYVKNHLKENNITLEE